MYDFTIQKKMLKASALLLKDNGLFEISAFGGGTALAAYYWNHRYSTDIDIFLYAQENKTQLLKPNKWSGKVTSLMKELGYSGNFIHNNIYTEIGIDGDSKIQFFDVIKKSINPYKKVSLWGEEILIESVEEIIAKKIYYRADIGNARDLFDIALAIHKEPEVLDKTTLSKEKIKLLYETVSNIKNSKELKDEYLLEIDQMSPNKEYKNISINTIDYLYNILENYCGAYDIGYELSDDEYKLIENSVYEQIVK